MFIEKETITLALKDRLLLIVMLVGMGLALVLIASSLLQIRPSDVQIPVRYSAYGVTNLYRDQWFYLISFVGAGVLFFVANPLITLKLLQEKGREFALTFSAVTILITLIASLLTLAVFRVVSISL
jgi:hypothetical protein